MQKKSSPTRRQFIQKATALTLGTMLVQGCGSEVTPENPSGSDPTEAQPTTDPSDPTNPTNPTDPTDTVEPEPGSDPTNPSEPGDTICEETSADIEGPFYREDPPHRATLVEDGEPGRPLIIEGYVYAADCETPLANAVVDVWHADDDGAYDNASDAFRMRGQMKTNAEGYYAYTTIRPGRYLNGSTYRPEHIHYKASYETSSSDSVTLTTQLYFEGDPHLETDPWAVPQRTIPLETEDNESFRGRFDIVLPVELK